jgi:PAS domain S-box-containing protein
MAQDGTGVPAELKERAVDEAPIGIAISDPDCEGNPLVYVNEAFEELTGYDRSEAIGRNCRFLQGEETDPGAVAALRTGIDAGEPVSVELLNYRADGERFWNEVTVAPLSDDSGEVTHFVGFQDDVSDRKDAELAAERERAALDGLVDRINGLLGDVTEVLVRSVSRAECERAVCERVAATDPYVFAWLGEPDRVGERLAVTSVAGAADAEEGELAVDLDADTPVARAHRTRSVQTVADPDDGSLAVPIEGARSVAAVPLASRDRDYGVLTVYADNRDAFDDRETVVLEALGRTVATAFNAAESRRILTADNLVELEFEVRDRGLFFVDLSARRDCRLDYEGAVSGEDGSLSMFFTSDAAPAAVLDYVAVASDVDGAELVSDDRGGALFEFHVGTDSVVTELAERGVKIRSIGVDGGAARMRVELPAEADSRAVADRLTERHPETELVGYRERERPPTTKREFIAALEDRLTERQLTALQRAYVSGYYERDRSTTGEELAGSMGISRSTFHQHLRTAERKLIGEFFAERT